MPAAATIGELLRASGLSRLEADLLLAEVLGCTRIQLITGADRAVAPADVDCYRALCARRDAGEPVAWLLGRREFYGLDFAVTADVLIPRPETELLVDLALEWLDPADGSSLLDLGTGSGAIPVAVAVARSRRGRRTRVTAVDVSPAALDVARANARRHDADIRLLRSDWFDALSGERFDVIVANPPYVRAGDPHLDEGDVRFEPRLALVGGADGLDAIRHLLATAAAHLVDAGRIAIEHGYDQGQDVAAIFTRHGFVDVRRHDDLAGIWRVTSARRGEVSRSAVACGAANA